MDGVFALSGTADSASTPERVGGIYVIRNNVNGKVYVGSAVDFAKRWGGHRWRLENGRHHSRHLQAAWKIYGSEAFTFEWEEILHKSPSESRADYNKRMLAREQWNIDRYQAANGKYGYNVSPTAGNTLGVPCHYSTRIKIGAANKGRKHSAEEQEKRNRYFKTDKARIRYSKLMRSEDTRSRVSRTKGGTGNVLSAEDIASAIAEYNTGTISTKRLAVKYGVGYGTMWNATRGNGPKLAETKVDVGKIISGNDEFSTSKKLVDVFRGKPVFRKCKVDEDGKALICKSLMENTHTISELAAMYDVGVSYIKKIALPDSPVKPRKPNPSRALTDDQVRKMRRMYDEKVSLRLLGLEFDVSLSCVRQVVGGLTYRDVA